MNPTVDDQVDKEQTAQGSGLCNKRRADDGPPRVLVWLRKSEKVFQRQRHVPTNWVSFGLTRVLINADWWKWLVSISGLQPRAKGAKGRQTNGTCCPTLAEPGTLRAALVAQARPPACQGMASNAGDIWRLWAYVAGLSAMLGRGLNNMLPV